MVIIVCLGFECMHQKLGSLHQCLCMLEKLLPVSDWTVFVRDSGIIVSFIPRSIFLCVYWSYLCCKQKLYLGCGWSSIWSIQSWRPMQSFSRAPSQVFVIILVPSLIPVFIQNDIYRQHHCSTHWVMCRIVIKDLGVHLIFFWFALP